MTSANDNRFPVSEIWRVNNFLEKITAEYPDLYGNSYWSYLVGSVEAFVEQEMARHKMTYIDVLHAIAQGDIE